MDDARIGIIASRVVHDSACEDGTHTDADIAGCERREGIPGSEDQIRCTDSHIYSIILDTSQRDRSRGIREEAIVE